MPDLQTREKRLGVGLINRRGLTTPPKLHRTQMVNTTARGARAEDRLRANPVSEANIQMTTDTQISF